MNKIRILLLLTLLPGLALLADACKKKEQTTTIGYLEGALSFRYPRYLGSGSLTASFIPDKRLFHPDGEEATRTMAYQWKVTPGMATETVLSRTDTFKYSFPADTIGDFTVTCTVVPSGNYYPTAHSVTVSLVREGIGENGSLPLGNRVAALDSSWSWKGYDYVSTKISGKNWMRSNLTAQEDRSGNAVGAGYRGYNLMYGVFGGYYNWNEAMNACPDGWRLPSEEEWTAMAAAVKPAAAAEPQVKTVWKGLAGEMMCYYLFNTVQQRSYEPTVNVSGKSRLDVKMLGCATDGKYFNYLGQRAFFWTASEKDVSGAWCRYFCSDSPDVYVCPMDKASFYANVRCIKD